MPPAPQQTVPPVFTIKVDNGLYLDSQGRFSASPPDSGAPVYSVAGGLLSLTTQVKGKMIGGQLAILPLKDEPGWESKLRILGLDEDSLEFVERVSGIVGDVATIVGWVKAAAKHRDRLHERNHQLGGLRSRREDVSVRVVPKSLVCSRVFGNPVP
jgi:hypothetical protein